MRLRARFGFHGGASLPGRGCNRRLTPPARPEERLSPRAGSTRGLKLCCFHGSLRCRGRGQTVFAGEFRLSRGTSLPGRGCNQRLAPPARPEERLSPRAGSARGVKLCYFHGSLRCRGRGQTVFAGAARLSRGASLPGRGCNRRLTPPARPEERLSPRAGSTRGLKLCCFHGSLRCRGSRSECVCGRVSAFTGHFAAGAWAT